MLSISHSCANPTGPLVQDSAGNLFGTTSFGGMDGTNCAPGAGCGTIFELSPDGNGGWKQSEPYSFKGGSDGSFPGALLIGSDGDLYGTTPNGGQDQACGGLGCGTIFKLTYQNRQWLKTIVHAFSGDDGSSPVWPLIQDAAGNFYGATYYGGNSSCPYNSLGGCGVVFKLSPSGQETVLHKFSGVDGLFPAAGLLLDPQTNILYGTTTDGGDSVHCALRCGVVFQITQ